MATVIVCASGCEAPCVVAWEEAESQTGPKFVIYKCEACGRKAALILEPATGAMTDSQKSWVEREVARHGAFFPSDYTGSRRNW